MLTAKEVRIEISKKIANEFLPNDKIAAIAVSGSTARGGVDDYSDLEIAFFWKSEPKLEERTNPIKVLGGNITRQITPNIEYFYGVDNFSIEEFAVDFVHNLLPSFDRLIEKVHEDIDIDLKKQGLMAITSSFYPIYGNEVLESLKSKVSEYSDDYQRKVLINTKFPNLDVLKLHAFRKDFVPYYKHLSKGLTSILSCISAVNKSYFPGEKRIGWLIESFEIKPTDLHIKMEKILRGNYSDSIKNLEELI